MFTNVTSPSTKAKLRILFEVAPIGLLVRSGAAGIACRVHMYVHSHGPAPRKLLVAHCTPSPCTCQHCKRSCRLCHKGWSVLLGDHGPATCSCLFRTAADQPSCCPAAAPSSHRSRRPAATLPPTASASLPWTLRSPSTTSALRSATARSARSGGSRSTCTARLPASPSRRSRRKPAAPSKF